MAQTNLGKYPLKPRSFRKYEIGRCTPLLLEEFERTAVTVILGMAMKLITGRTVKVG